MGALTVAVAQLGVGEAVLANEVLAVTAEVAGINSKQREAGATVAALEALQGWSLLAAGDAPRRPEVDQDPAAAVAGERFSPAAAEAGSGPPGASSPTLTPTAPLLARP